MNESQHEPTRIFRRNHSFRRQNHAANARTHLAALAEFGVTAATLDQFGAAIQTAEALSRETQHRIELKDLTHDKEQALDACFQWGRKLRVRL